MFVGTKSSLSRLNNYKAKIRAYSGTGSQPDYTAPVLQHKLDEMYRRATGAFDDQASYGNRLTALLGREGASCITMAGYFAFAGQLYSICRRMVAEARAAEAAILVAAWTSRGLTQSILQDIRSEIFNIAAPVGP